MKTPDLKEYQLEELKTDDLNEVQGGIIIATIIIISAALAVHCGNVLYTATH